jgi:hypothetical protein
MMRPVVLAVRPRASLPLRVLYGRRTEKVALSPAAAARGVRGWFIGSRAVFEAGMVRVVESPWPPIVRRFVLLVAVLVTVAAVGPVAPAGVACAAYLVGTIDARLRG